MQRRIYSQFYHYICFAIFSKAKNIQRHCTSLEIILFAFSFYTYLDLRLNSLYAYLCESSYVNNKQWFCRKVFCVYTLFWGLIINVSIMSKMVAIPFRTIKFLLQIDANDNWNVCGTNYINLFCFM